MSNRRFTESEDSDVKHLYTIKRWTITRIAAKYKCSIDAVRSSLRRQQVSTEKRNPGKGKFLYEMATKVCNTCNRRKPIGQFYAKKCPNVMSISAKCKRCTRNHLNEWKLKNRDKIKAAERKRALKRAHGMTIEQWQEMYDDQNGLCLICKEPAKFFDPRWGVTQRLAVDHDHKTGKVRGLLCHSCNRGLGYFADDPNRLREAAAYIEKHVGK